MQAIARVNRVFQDKEGGLVVDYVGIASALKRAMNDYTTRDKKNYGDTDVAKVAYPKFLEKLSICRDLFYGYDYSKFKTGSDLERAKTISGAVNFIIDREREKEKEAFKICLEKIRKHELEMKLIDCEYTFDNNKVLFYFTADGRIDFRELVKDLAAVFKTRIELRQIGVRDETKILGGIGICGRPLCCHSYLADFVPVSIKMAKEQNLSLNPTKISGVCGRLMCCLTNEEETYEELNSRLPNVGDFVTTPEGLKGDVHSVNVLRQLVKVIVTLDNDEKEIHEYKASEHKFKPRRKKKEMKLTKEEMAELRALEERNGVSKLDDN